MDPHSKKSDGKKTPYYKAILVWIANNKLDVLDDRTMIHDMFTLYNELVHNKGIALPHYENYDTPGAMKKDIDKYVNETVIHVFPKELIVKEYCFDDLTVYHPTQWENEGELCFGGGVVSRANWCVHNEKTFKRYQETGKLYFVTRTVNNKEKRYALIFLGKDKNRYEIRDVYNRVFEDKVEIARLKPLLNKLPITLRFIDHYSNDLMGFYNREELLASKNSNLLMNYARNVNRPWPEAEKYIMKDSENALEYAQYILKARWPEAEPYIMSDAWNAYDYAMHVIKGPWPEAEPIIIQDTDVANHYAEDILKRRWHESEPFMLQKASDAYYYAKDIIKDKWPEAEAIIATDASSSYGYAMEVLGGRFPEGEAAIIKEPRYAYCYARDIIGGRWPEAEESISKNICIQYLYERDILQIA
jgi:hypothetical protein